MCYHAIRLGAVCVRMCSPEAGAFWGYRWGYFRLPRYRAIPPPVNSRREADFRPAATVCLRDLENGSIKRSQDHRCVRVLMWDVNISKPVGAGEGICFSFGMTGLRPNCGHSGSIGSFSITASRPPHVRRDASIETFRLSRTFTCERRISWRLAHIGRDR